MGATVAWGRPFGTRSHIAWRERRDLFPEGVASGDPDSSSVLFWTRRPMAGENLALKLPVEVSEDEMFTRVVAPAAAPVSAASDWTCRVLAGGLKPQPSVLVPIRRFRRPWQPYRQDCRLVPAPFTRRQTRQCLAPSSERGALKRRAVNDVERPRIAKAPFPSGKLYSSVN
jgi:hypothetical protein